MHPGVVSTGIWQASRGIVRLIVRLAQPFMLSSERASKAVVWLVNDPALAHTSGRYFVKDKETRSSDLSYDEAVARQLWKVSEALMG